jgi:hypothetical protein
MSTIDLNNSAFINDNYPPDKLREKCLELVNLPYQPKYCDYVERIFKENNDKFIRKNAKDEFFCEKLREVKEYAQGIRYTKKIKISDFKKIREMAISKGGFLTYDVRKILYKKIYLLNNNNVFNMLYIDYDSIVNKLWDFDKTDIFSEKRIYEDIRENCDGRTIDADYRRSRILQLAQNEEDKKMAKLITLDLKKFLNLMCCLNNNIYNYYQGYHDLALFFILLYHKRPYYAVSVFQRFSEFNLKELLTCKYNKRKLINGVYDMIEMFFIFFIIFFIVIFINKYFTILCFFLIFVIISFIHISQFFIRIKFNKKIHSRKIIFFILICIDKHKFLLKTLLYITKSGIVDLWLIIKSTFFPVFSFNIGHSS